MEIFVNILTSLSVGFYIGVLLLRISSFNQVKIYASEVMFGISSTDAPKESDFEPEFTEISETGEPIFQNVRYSDAIANYGFFSTICFGDFKKLILVSEHLESLGHNKAACTCYKVYEDINKAERQVYEAMTADGPYRDDHITPQKIHEKHPQWDDDILHLKPNWWSLLKPIPNGQARTRNL